MRLSEIVSEAKVTKLRKGARDAQRSVETVRDPDGIDRFYHLNRMMMAMAVADGSNTKAVDVPISTWAEKNNTAHPYTDEEHNMVHAALNTIPSDHRAISKRSPSKELPSVNKSSPVPQNSGKNNKRGS
jgi:predicted ABC-class ATPase